MRKYGRLILFYENEMIEELTIDDPENIETRNAASILGCLSLRIIKISRDGYNRIFDVHSQILFSSFLHFSQDLKVIKSGTLSIYN